jgi:hypothetical protein
MIDLLKEKGLHPKKGYISPHQTADQLFFHILIVEIHNFFLISFFLIRENFFLANPENKFRVKLKSPW